MAGIRITHPAETNVTYTLVDGNRPYPEPVLCGRCGRHHEFKTYHLDLDGEGAAIVSPEVWERLQAIPGNPFQLESEVANPPARVLDLRAGTRPTTPVVAHKE